MDPAPVTIRARWPAHRRLVVDLALGGAVVGIGLGTVTLGRFGALGLVLGALAGAMAGLLLGPRRFHLTVDGSGLEIGRLTGTLHVPWDEVAALGIEDGWQGRRGRTAALAVGRHGDEWPTAVPALSFVAAGFRIGGTPPDEVLRPHRDALLEPVRPWAEARGVPLVTADFDDWWDRAGRAPADGAPGRHRG